MSEVMTGLLLAVALFAGPASAGEPTYVRPDETDSRITAFDEPHRVLVPEGAPRGVVLLYLPGTGGTPEKALFTPFTETAARLGYHVVVLMYPDKIAAQKRCGESPDPDCDVKFRDAIISGGPIGPRRRITTADSIENRFEKLLTFLARQQPEGGWSQFVDANGGVRWRKVAVAGLSQGGGHSYMLGKRHELDRVLMFGSPKDYSFRFQAPARGFDAAVRTPLRRFFAYNHVRDNGNGCTHDQQRSVLDQIGLTRLGVADVDGAAPPFGHAHVLYTDADLGDSTKFHGSVLRGNLKSNPPVWTYVLSEAVE
jgi:hypothetical protein